MPRGTLRNSSFRDRRRRRRRLGRLSRRDLHLEPLEARVLLAVGPQLIGINPNAGAVLVDDDVRQVAPTDLTFRFDDGQVIDATSLDGIQITQSGFDGQFGDANDILLTPGFVGIGDLPNEVVYRFSEPLPDDLYRVEVLGSGATPL